MVDREISDLGRIQIKMDIDSRLKAGRNENATKNLDRFLVADRQRLNSLEGITNCYNPTGFRFPLAKGYEYQY